MSALGWAIWVAAFSSDISAERGGCWIQNALEKTTPQIGCAPQQLEELQIGFERASWWRSPELQTIVWKCKKGHTNIRVQQDEAYETLTVVARRSLDNSLRKSTASPGAKSAYVAVCIDRA